MVCDVAAACLGGSVRRSVPPSPPEPSAAPVAGALSRGQPLEPCCSSRSGLKGRPFPGERCFASRKRVAFAAMRCVRTSAVSRHDTHTLSRALQGKLTISNKATRVTSAWA